MFMYMYTGLRSEERCVYNNMLRHIESLLSSLKKIQLAVEVLLHAQM